MKKKSVLASFAFVVIGGSILAGGCEVLDDQVAPLAPPSGGGGSVAGEVAAGVPRGWTAFPGGGPDSLPGRCVIGIDEAMRSAGTDNLSIRCANPLSYGGIYQTFGAVDFRNKRVRFSALMRTLDVVGNGRTEGVATLWMRVEGANVQQPLLIARLGERALRGTMDWTPVEIVLDVPGDTARIHIGFIMQTRGQMWIRDLNFEEAPEAEVTVVPVDQSTTGPRNLELD
jgi:hypothetical protein